MENVKDDTVILASPEVVALLTKANKAAGSMLAYCRQAADKAAAQIDATKKPAETIADIIGAYNVQFKGFDANVKQNFVAFLHLHAVKDAPIVIEVKSKDAKGEIFTTAGEMLDKPISKHALRDMAKQVREHIGTARASGGGNKPKSTKAPIFPPAPDMTVKMTDVDAFNAWTDNLEEYLSDAVYRPRIDARLIELGYTLTKAATGRIVKGSASA